jgi:hypothetical protein
MLVVIGDFDFVGILAFPAKAHAILVVDADAVLAGPVALKGFESVAGRNAQMVEGGGSFELGEFAEGDPVNGGGKLPGAAAQP